jgi:hypothetical protein
VIPRHAVAVVAVALLAVGCTSESSPAEKSAAAQSAKRTAALNAQLRKAVQTIKQCARDNDGEYPPAIKNQSGTITMLCGPVGRSLTVPKGSHLTYRPRHGGFTVQLTTPDGRVDYGTGPIASPSS